MNAVLYTEDMEPITVVRVSQFLWDRLVHGDVVQIYVPPLFSIKPFDELMPRSASIKIVHIYGERFRRKGHDHLMLFTRDEENALALRSEFLPGQHAEVQRRQRSAFADGFLTALSSYGE